MATTDSFCFIAHIKNVDTRDNQRLQNYIDEKGGNNQQFLPYISAFQKWRALS